MPTYNPFTRQSTPGIERFSGASGSGSSSSSYSRQQAEESERKIRESQAKAAAAEKAAKELAEKKAAEERAKAEKIKNEAQRKAQLLRIERVKNERIQAAKLRAMNSQQRTSYFTNQANLAKASEYQRLQSKGKTLTPQAKEILKRAVGKQGQIEEAYISERKVGETKSGVPVYEPYITTTEKGGTIRVTRPLTSEEKKEYKISSQALQVPEKLTKTDVRRLEKETNELLQNIQIGKGGVSKEVQLGVLTVAGAIISAGEGTVQTIKLLPKAPSAIVNYTKKVIKSPSVIVEDSGKVLKSIQRSGKKFGRILKITPTVAIAKIGTEFLILQGTSQSLKIIGRLKGKFSSKLSNLIGRTKTTPLGIKELRKIKKVGKIEIIRPRGTKLEVKPLKAVKEASLKGQLKKVPKLAPATKIEKRILKIVKKRGDAVSGSYAQESLLKKAFTKKHKDLDLLSVNRNALIKDLKKEFGKNIKFIKKKNAITLKYKGKEVADIVEFAKGEKVGRIAYAKKFGIKKVNGLNLIKQEARLASKVEQLGKLGERVRGAKGKKVIRDIESLYGKKLTLRKPSIKGAYGFSEKELSKYIGKKVKLTTAQQDLFKVIKDNLKKSANAREIVKSQVDLVKRKIIKPKELKLQKWLYATPEDLGTGVAQVRVSRLGIGADEEARLLDLLSGDVAFKKGKPAIYVFPKEKIFAPTKKLTKAITTKTKGFTVPYFSTELEVVLGKGYAIKRGKKLASRIIDGVKVPIYELEKVKITKAIKDDISKLKSLNRKLVSTKGKKTAKNIAKSIYNKEKLLDSKLKKLTGLDYSSYITKGRKIYPVGRKISSSVITKVSSGVYKVKKSSKVSRPFKKTSYKIPRSRIIIPKRYSGKSIKYTSRGSPYVVTKSGARFLSSVSKPVKQISKKVSKPVSRARYKPIAKKAIEKRIRIKQVKRKITKKPKQIEAFNVYGKSGKRFLKLNKRPLTKNDALSLGTYAIDNTTSKQLKLVPVGKPKKLGRIRAVEKNYFNRNKRKLRPFKIRGRKQILIRPRYIEKRKYGIDTRGEKKGLKIAKFIKQRRGVSKKRVGRRVALRKSPQRITRKRISPSRKKVMLKNLAKARRVRLQNLKRRTKRR